MRFPLAVTELKTPSPIPTHYDANGINIFNTTMSSATSAANIYSVPSSELAKYSDAQFNSMLQRYQYDTLQDAAMKSVLRDAAAMSNYLLTSFYANSDVYNIRNNAQLQNRYMALMSNVTRSYSPSSNTSVVYDNALLMWNSSAIFALPISYNLYNTHLLQYMSGDASASISATLVSFPATKGEQSDNAFLVAIFITVAFSFIASTFVSFHILEQESKIKQQQLLSGVSIYAYW